MEQDQQQAGQGATVAQRRASMPIVAAFIDECRAAYGADLVDRQLATGMQAAREHAQVLATQGEAAARRWHRANAHRCTFFAVEGGRTVGLPSPFGRAE
jgi:hypothetical protein